VKFKEVVTRLTGISTPIFGASWNPPEAECSIARRVIALLEDRRVLYSPSEMEVPHHCVMSVQEIRRFLTQELTKLEADRELAQSLRAMRAACRKFLNTVDGPSGEVVSFGATHGHWASWCFNGALGELRGTFGVHLAKLAVQYGLDIEDDLAIILPARDED
jgi:hypothetical protein